MEDETPKDQVNLATMPSVSEIFGESEREQMSMAHSTQQRITLPGLESGLPMESTGVTYPNARGPLSMPPQPAAGDDYVRGQGLRKFNPPDKIEISERFVKVHDHFEKAQYQLNSLGELCQQAHNTIRQSQALQNDLAIKFKALSEHTRLILKNVENAELEQEG
eukprot:GEMP01094653.1.p1 GENE.GEMP01094653.1~~GEMP01094653.1.p1  ORF type:complete len:190 (+),score=30.67 GEMP01094653.1:79-570(+)